MTDRPPVSGEPTHCDVIVNNGMGEPTECGRTIPCALHRWPYRPPVSGEPPGAYEIDDGEHVWKFSGAEKPIQGEPMTTITDEQRGVYGKYRVERIGGTPGKHDNCWYYVLDWEHDKFALPALKAYAEACLEEYPDLAGDLFGIITNREMLLAGRRHD